ncbi:MAG TPA: hypothetical protein VM490_24360 [Armatimonadaceae bacterium]|nr:hypothetical protein [Armatimonadaceae bacterium]
MNCSDRDQDILLFEHGALSGLQRSRTEWHLRHCPRCQERREHLALLGGLMAGAIRDGDVMPPLPSFPGMVVSARATAKNRPAPAARPAFIFAVTAAAAVIAAGALAYKATALTIPIDSDKVPPHVTYIYRSARPARPARPAPKPAADCPPPKTSASPKQSSLYVPGACGRSAEGAPPTAMAMASVSYAAPSAAAPTAPSLPGRACR